jgi:uncharacterized phage protein gp47/JayE
MPAFIAKTQPDILRNALTKLGNTTPITAVAPGSIARALAEVFARELGDMYAILDFNTSMAFLSSAQGRALDLIGVLYNVTRKTLTAVAASDENVGAFNFYLDSPAPVEIVIPVGTQVMTNALGYVGDQYVYSTNNIARIPIGRSRVFVSLRPAFNDSIFTAGAGTLTRHNYAPPPGVVVRCTNAKAIPAEVGYESDDDYRTRLIKAVRTAAGGTAESVRFTALSLAGVRDVRVRSAPYGLGSFEVIVVPENYGLMAQVQVAVASGLEAVRPIGVRMFVKGPQFLVVGITATAMIRSNIGTNKADVARRVEIAAMRHINTLLPGDPLVYNQLIQSMMDSADLVTDVTIRSFLVNGNEQLRRNVTTNEDQQLVPGTITVTPS